MGISKKKATNDDVTKMSRGLMLNHQDIAGANVSLAGAATSLAGGLGMEGTSISNVKGLVREDSEGEPSHKEEEAEGDEENGEAERNKKILKFWDRDRAVNKAQKSLKTALADRKRREEKDARLSEAVLGLGSASEEAC